MHSPQLLGYLNDIVTCHGLSTCELDLPHAELHQYRSYSGDFGGREEVLRVADESLVVTEHAVEVALWSDGDAQGRHRAAIRIIEDHVTSTQPT